MWQEGRGEEGKERGRETSNYQNLSETVYVWEDRECDLAEEG